MKKMLFYFLCVSAIVCITVVVIYGSETGDEKNISFLQSYGWEVSREAIEIEEIKIPEVFDDVYDNYNRLQLRAGLDLRTCKGKKAVRYTYSVLNYPNNTSENVRANVICVKGKPVAGDIMTVNLDGFMHSLNFPAEEKENCGEQPFDG